MQETHLAKSDSKINKNFLLLPIDPTTGSPYTCNNYEWQGVTYNDNDIPDDYLRKYKILAPITFQEMVDGGIVLEDTDPDTVPFQHCYYIAWLFPVSGQDCDKLGAKPVKKREIDIKSKEDKALEMLSKMNIG